MNKTPALSSAIVSIITVLVFSQVACSGQTQSNFIKYVPPSYYNCTDTTPENLLQAYFGRYNAVPGAEIIFNGQVFVFKNIVITDCSLKYATADYIWVQSIIKCYFLQSGSVRQLRAGQKVDVVGVDAGISKEYTGALVFTGCVFLPAGSVQIPVEGISALTLPSY
ncbi:MAG: hypothetical protein C4542_05080 [Dehalococcoidia bacterium]|nr:MAG: hypothetical protein C4542_05080 [Dehalococcoidia bacterium]